MKLPAKIIASLLPFLLLTGCLHKSNQPQIQPLAPPIEDAPPPKPVPSPTNLPPPVVTIPGQPDTTAVIAPEPPKPKPQPKRKKPTSKPAAAPDSRQVAALDKPVVSAVGQLSSGDSSDLHIKTSDMIATIERSLNSISRKLNDQEQNTAGQIHAFIKQARTALVSGDVDGAHTLAVKAQVLLSELNQ
jgi:outer membrane biosynthesis protein TonB